METAVSALLTGIREALFIWLVLVGVAALTCTLLSAPARQGLSRHARREAREARKARREAREARKVRPGPHRTAVASRSLPGSASRNPLSRVEEPATVGSHVEDLSRYAQEIAVAADRSADAAQRWRSEWLAVQKAKEAAWCAYENAERAAHRAFRAAAFPTPQVPLTADELAARERYLHRAARDAYRCGELSLGQLNDALSHRNGWDPRLHPFEQQVILRRIGMQRKLRAYRTVSAMECQAWQSAEVAEVAKHSLRMEAFSAQTQARQAYRRAKPPVEARYVSSGFSPRPSLAVR